MRIPSWRSLRNRVIGEDATSSRGEPVDQIDWTADSDWLLAQQETLRARNLLRLVVLFFIAMIAWASIAEVDEVTRGEGRVIPSSQVQIVQAVDGGVVEQIHIREGQIVNRGETLLRIDPTRFVSNFRENRSQLLALTVRAARLRALVQRQPFEAPEAAKQQIPDILALESRLYQSTQDELDAQISIAKRQLEQREREVQEARSRRDQAKKALALATRELRVTRPLQGSGAVSEVEILRLERDIARLTGERDQAIARILRLQSAMAESKRKIEEVELNFRNRLQGELAETLAKLDSLKESGTGLADRVAKAEVLSPVRGTIKRVLVSTRGAVVQPGQALVEIVPLDDALLLEARIAPRDIGFLRPDMPAVVKFTAYDFAIYGALEAKVEHISADSVIDEKGNAFFLIRLRTDKSFIGDGLPIIPGMVAEVDVLTGRKTILDYLLKPILRAKNRALTER